MIVIIIITLGRY